MSWRPFLPADQAALNQTEHSRKRYLAGDGPSQSAAVRAKLVGAPLCQDCREPLTTDPTRFAAFTTLVDRCDACQNQNRRLRWTPGRNPDR